MKEKIKSLLIKIFFANCQKRGSDGSNGTKNKNTVKFNISFEDELHCPTR